MRRSLLVLSILTATFVAVFFVLDRREGGPEAIKDRNVSAASSPEPEIIVPERTDQDYSWEKVGLPAPVPGSQTVWHFAYTLSYNEDHEQANWVAYRLRLSDLGGTVSRSDDFRQDPAVKTGSAHLEDYKYSGYDRGHLVPAGDMKWSKKAMSETFMFSNISPQDGSFNSGIWNRLEEEVRYWARRDKQIYIVTGPVLTTGLKKLRKTRVSVPQQFYKVVIDLEEPGYKAIAFIMPNEKSSKPIWDYAVTIDEIERTTGLDFFPALPDSLEKSLEGQAEASVWK